MESPTASPKTISVVIPTYGRDRILIDTLRALIVQKPGCERFRDLVIVDQTAQHNSKAEATLQSWHDDGEIRWLRLPEPNLTGAMNLGVSHVDSDIVLFTDDDIIPAEGLIDAHLQAHREHPEAGAVVGQILQPDEQPADIDYTARGSVLERFMDFPFYSTRGCYIENAMAGNLSVKRERFLAAGGFDENFTPPVASRFESEFAKRLIENGDKIWFEPTASIHHLYAESGGTRSKGSFLNSMSPRYGVGDYYFALRRGRGWEKWWYILRRPFRQVRTRFHLRRPWWIPVKIIGELRAIPQALRLHFAGPRLVETEENGNEAKYD